MRLLQVSDLHLERTFGGLTEPTPALAAVLLTANQTTFQNIIQVAIKEKVDLVIFAGDTFHAPQVSIATQHLFMMGMADLAQAGIQVALTFGNHDYYSPQRFWFSWPENVHVFTSERVTTKIIPVTSGKLQVVGFSYQQPWLESDLAAAFPQKETLANLPTIGIYHGENSTQGHYAPFRLETLKNLHYDYIALGHIHVPDVLQFAPPIIYGGTPLGHNKKETQVKGVVLAEIGEKANFKFIPVAPLRFGQQTLTLTGTSLAENLQELQNFLRTKAQKNWQIWQLTLVVNNDLSEWQDPNYGQDLRRYLNQWCQEQDLLQFMQELILQHVKEGKLPLPLSSEVLQQYGKLYQEPAVLQEILGELWSQPTLRDLLAGDADYQAAVVAGGLQLVQTEFDFQGEGTP